MRKQTVRWAMIALAGLLTVIASSCGKQDLYELPESPYVEVGRLPLPTINFDVDILGNYAFVAAGQAGLHIVDISNPAAPLLVKTLDTTRNPIAVRVVRSFVDHEILDTVLLSEGTEGLRTYDVTNPLDPVDYNQFTTAINAQDFAVREPADPDDPFLVVLGDDWKGVRFFASNPGFPGILDYDGVFEKTFGEAQDVAWKDNYIFVADDQTGLTVMDASVIVLGSIEIVATVDTPGNAVRIDIEGDYAYIADKRKGLAIFDISDPLDPVHVFQMPLDSWCLNVEVVGHLAFIAGDDAGMHIVDVSNPRHPIYAGNVRSANATSIAVREDGLVLLTDEDDGLRVMQGPAFADVTPPAAIHHLSGEPLSSSSVSLTWYATGDDAHVGQAASFQLRHALADITDQAAWDAATVVADLPLPGEIGTEHTLTLAGLAIDTDHFFVGRALDEAGNVSALVPATMVHTYPEGTFLLNLSVSPEFGDTDQIYTFEITYTDAEGDLPVTHDLEIDGETFAMSYVSGDHATDALYRLETTLPAGAHSYQAFFDDGDGHAPSSLLEDGPLVGNIAYTMGSPAEELGHEPDEAQFMALLTHIPIAAAEEVSQSEWTTLMGSNPSRFPGADLPVESVTWLEAVTFCNAKSLDEGLAAVYVINGRDVTWDRDAAGWRLPTEAEWEWLCRAGSEVAFHNGEITDQTGDDPVLDASGWYLGNSANITHDGGGLLANSDGGYDYHGNVAEWCWDWYASTYPAEPTIDPEGPALGYSHVIRGGSWFSQAKDCRSAARDQVLEAEDTRLDTVGLRVVRNDTD